MSVGRPIRARRLVAVAALVVALPVLSACGSGSSSAAGSGGEGGTLRWAINANDSWDPVTSAAGNEVRHLSLVYASLTQLDPKGQAKPGLAQSWKYTDDGTTLTFTLRPNLKFTDGTTLDADAVKTSLDRALHQDASVLAQPLDHLKSVAVSGTRTVRLTLKQKDYTLPLVLGGKAGMIVSPKAIRAGVSKLPTTPVGAGPFRLTKFTPGAESTLVKNPGYWDAKNIHLGGVDLEYLSNPQSILAGLQSGSLDLASSTGDQVAPAKRAGLDVTQFPSLAVASIEVNSAIKPFTDPRVAQAVNYAIDRQALVRTQAGGIGSPSFQAFPKGYVGYSPSVANLYPYDPQKARDLLKQAGYPNGVTIPITYFDEANYKALTEQIQSQLAAVGIKSTLRSLPLSQVATRVYVKHDVAFNPNGIVGRESPAQMLDVQYGADGLLNPGRTASPELTAAIAKAQSEPLDSPAYPKALQAATALAARQSAVPFLYTQPTVLLHTSKVTGIQPFVVATRLDGVRLSK